MKVTKFSQTHELLHYICQQVDNNAEQIKIMQKDICEIKNKLEQLYLQQQSGNSENEPNGNLSTKLNSKESQNETPTILQVNIEGQQNLSGGRVYEGEFFNGQISGLGKIIYQNKSSLQGDFINDSEILNGHYTTENGNILCFSLFKDNLFENPILNYKSGDRCSFKSRLNFNSPLLLRLISSTHFNIIGLSQAELDQLNEINVSNVDSKQNQQNEQTVENDQIKYPNGDVFTGSTSNKKPVKGKMTFKNGKEYNGSYLNEVFHGQGTFTYKNKNKLYGEFKEGKLISGKMKFINKDKCDLKNVNEEPTKGLLLEMGSWNNFNDGKLKESQKEKIFNVKIQGFTKAEQKQNPENTNKDSETKQQKVDKTTNIIINLKEFKEKKENVGLALIKYFEKQIPEVIKTEVLNDLNLALTLKSENTEKITNTISQLRIKGQMLTYYIQEFKQ
ncbi:phosphatidylinositol-4-phosphate_5-kinase [Hexamita inflata]|uniref:Phosphatidylinositol-4-phosphate 5-kinase n=1 Tax=Hexamita inflata TaxID=28002 RepID=A0AA86RDX8_9EUKA|nr:phosphatidylinositol-4-phosphate 5-kinase [Hexamita inflata]